jgi:chemotaxis protein MotB
MFTDDPTLPGNRRIAITLLREAPPLPAGHGL